MRQPPWHSAETEGKIKDTVNSRIDLVDMGIRRKLHPYQEGHVVKNPPA